MVAANAATQQMLIILTSNPQRNTLMTQTNKKSSEQPSAKLALPSAASNNANEAKKTREKVFAIGKDGAEHLAKSADAVTKTLNDAIAMSRDNMETCIECGNLTTTFATDISSEVCDYTNKALSDTAEASRELFACRTINDMFELQNKIVKNTMDSFFDQSTKLSEIMFEYATEVLEPINKQVTKATSELKL